MNTNIIDTEALKKGKVQWLACLALLVALFVSCSKEQEANKYGHSNNISTKDGYSMLSFQNTLQLYQKILEIESQDDLTQYETNLGYTSIGRLSDAFFSSIDYSSFNNAGELTAYMAANSKYIDTETEYDSAISYVPKFFHSRYRYVANEDGMYQVGDSIYRLFSTGTVSTASTNLDRLRYWTDDSLSLVANSQAFRFVPNHGLHYVAAVSGTASHTPASVSADGCFALPMDTVFVNTNKDMRIYSLFETFYTQPTGHFDVGIDSYCKIKVFGLWFTCKRNIEYHGTVVCHYRQYLGSGTGPDAYEDECTEYTYTMNEGPENSVHHRKPITDLTFEYHPNEVTVFWFFRSLEPAWYEVIRFKNINISVQAVSVSQTIAISNNQ
ncbi:MAG: hypothetical protein IJM33_03440 [Bacteroidales bacterium]|nr:hypothetical protein [Bacteroidales bacterium]MBR3411797.1 hypothetical protein [Bacteroidales bacterium]